MSEPCSTFSLANLNENVYLEVTIPSEQCVAAVSLAIYFLFWLTLRVGHLTHTIYRVRLYFQTTKDWRPLLRNQELVIQNLSSMIGVVGDIAFLCGYRTTGFALGMCTAFFALMPIFENMYPTLASIAHQLNFEEKSDYYKQDVWFVVCCNIIQAALIITAAVYYRRRELTDLKIVYVTHIVIVYFSSIWVWWRVRQSAQYCEKLVAGHAQKLQQTRDAMTGINQSLMNGEGDSFAATLAHSEAIHESCKKLHKTLKDMMIGYGSYAFTFLPMTVIIIAVTWNHPNGISYFNYVLYSMCPAGIFGYHGARRLARPPKRQVQGKAKNIDGKSKSIVITDDLQKTQLDSAV